MASHDQHNGFTTTHHLYNCPEGLKKGGEGRRGEMTKRKEERKEEWARERKKKTKKKKGISILSLPNIFI